jgi:hypothetical protein
MGRHVRTNFAYTQLAEQKRCLEAIMALDPTLDWAQAALTRWRRAN